MITKGRAIDEALRWMDEATINGDAPASAHLADYKDRAAHLLSGVVSVLAGQFRIPKTFTVVQTPINNLLGDSYSVHSVMPGKDYTADVNDMRALYLEVSGEVDVVVTRGGLELYHMKHYSREGFEPVRIVLPENSGKTSVRVSSDGLSSVRYAAAYDIPFSYADDVPANTPYAAYELPCDLREYDKCVRTSDGTNYEEFHDVRREGFRTFLLPRRVSGQFNFHYWRNPKDVPFEAANDTPLEVAPEAEALVGLKLASDLARGIPENQSVSYWLDAEFSSRIANLERQERGGILQIQSAYTIE